MNINLSFLRKLVWAILISSLPFYIAFFVQNNPAVISCLEFNKCEGQSHNLNLFTQKPNQIQTQQITEQNFIQRFITQNPNLPFINIDNQSSPPETALPSPEEPSVPTQPTPTPNIITEIETESQTVFEQILEIIQGPKTGGSGGQTSSGGGGTPPVITDCTTTQNAFTTLNLSCYQGRRTYNTHLLTLENLNPTTSCQVEIALNNTPTPALVNNFTTGNADFYFILSSIEPNLLSLVNLPAPEKIGTWTEWHNSTLQVELVNGNLQAANLNQSFTIPPNQSRNLGLITDCGTDTINSESATIRIKTSFFD